MVTIALGTSFICVMCGGQNRGKGVTQRLCQPLNRCDLVHAPPFTLPGGYSVDPYALDGQPECQSSLEAHLVLSSEDHVEVFATGLYFL